MRTTADVVEEVWAAKDILVRKGFSSADIHVNVHLNIIEVTYPKGVVQIEPPTDTSAWHTSFVDAWTSYCAEKGHHG